MADPTIFASYQTATAASPSKQDTVAAFTEAGAEPWSKSELEAHRMIPDGTGVIVLPMSGDPHRYDASGALTWSWTPPHPTLRAWDGVADGLGNSYLLYQFDDAIQVYALNSSGVSTTLVDIAWNALEPTFQVASGVSIELSRDGSMLFVLVDDWGYDKIGLLGIDTTTGAVVWEMVVRTDKAVTNITRWSTVRRDPASNTLFLATIGMDATDTYHRVKIMRLDFAGEPTTAPTETWTEEPQTESDNNWIGAFAVTADGLYVGYGASVSGGGDPHILTKYDHAGTLQWRVSNANYWTWSASVDFNSIAATDTVVMVGIANQRDTFPSDRWGFVLLNASTGATITTGVLPLEAYDTYAATGPGNTIVTPGPVPPGFPALDSPVRVDLSEDFTSRFTDAGISIDYLPNHEIARAIGQLAAIDDEITANDPLYTFWIATKAWNGGLVTYTGETVLGRLAALEPKSIIKRGPFTAQQALQELLASFQTEATWLTYEPVPELLVQTSVGPFAPQVDAIVLRQPTEDDPGATPATALGWLRQYLSLFEGYVARANQAGALEIVAPPWATAGDAAYFGEFGSETTLVASALYTRSWPWSGTSAVLNVTIVGEGDRGAVAFDDETVTDATPLTYHADLSTIGGDSYTIAWSIHDGRLWLVLTPDSPGITKPYRLFGTATNPAATGPATLTLPDSAVRLGETSELDIGYVVNHCQVRSQGQQFVEGTEAWSPAYIDFEPDPVYPPGMGALTGTAVRWQDGGPRSTWLPDPGGGYGREKVTTSWKVANNGIIDETDPIQLLLKFDAYWSAIVVDYLGQGVPLYTDQITPELYPGNVLFHITDADGVVTNLGEQTLPYTLPAISVPADGREVTLWWHEQRCTMLNMSCGFTEQTIKISFDSNAQELRFRVTGARLADAFGGRGNSTPSPWFMAPRIEMNATATAFTDAGETTTGTFGETEQLGDVAGLAESQTVYGKRKLTIDAGPFHLSAATCLRIAEAIVRARYRPTRVYTFRQGRAFPVRPDHGNTLVSVGSSGVQGPVIAWSYQEAHTPQGSTSEASIKVRATALDQLPGLEAALTDDRLDDGVLGQAVI